MKDFAIIVAMDEKRGIGKGGTLPWHLSTDLKYFARFTKKTENPSHQNAVLMGRVTWESIPDAFRPLPKRLNVVLTRNVNHSLPEGVERVNSLDQALTSLDRSSIERVFVIGGGKVFQEALSDVHCKELFITEVEGSFDCDTFFPEIDPERFERDGESETVEENGISFRFVHYRAR